LIADGVTFTLFVGATLQSRDDDQAPFLIAGAFGWFLGPPILHFAHGNVGEGFASLGLRIAPVVLAAAYGGSDCFYDRNDDGACVLLAVATVLSIPAAITLDAALLAYETTPNGTVALRRTPARSTNTFALGPWHDARRDAWGLGLRAAF
jgi:hypothetical protein